MELKRYWALVLRWSWLILLGTGVAGGVAFVISRNTTPVYRASSRLLIDEAPGSGSGNEYSQVLLEQRLTLTYIEILKTRPVLEETIERMGLPFSASQLGNRATVSAPQDTQIIVITVEDTDPDRAAAIANTLGEVFIDQNQDREALRYAEPIANWETRQAEIADEIEALETEINTLGSQQTASGQAALSRLETKLKETQIRYTEAFNNLNDLQVAQAKESSNVVQIEPAQAVRTPFRPRVMTDTLLAAVTGALVALGVVFLIEYLDDTVKTPDQVLEATNLTTLGAIALIEGESDPDRLITIRAPRDPISEAYRVLRTNVGYSVVDGGLSSMLVTSSSPGEGKSTTVANLAVTMAQTGRQVILVDADMRRPTLHQFFGLPNNHGLSTAIYDRETPVAEHIQGTKYPGLRVMTSGPIPPNPAELLNSLRMEQVLEKLQSESDVVLFDTPPTLTVADASILAPKVNGCLVVVETGRSKIDTLIQAVERLYQSNARVFGVVMNLLRPGRLGYYYSYYYDYYNQNSHYQDEQGRGSTRRARRQSRWPAWLPFLARR